MLSAPDVAALYELFSRAELPLESTALALRTRFQGVVRRYHVACAIGVLLHEPALLPSPLFRIAALYTLYDLYRPTPAEAHPFLSLLLDYADPPVRTAQPRGPALQLTWCERWVAGRMLADPTNAADEMGPQSPKQLMAVVDTTFAARAMAAPQMRAMVGKLREEGEVVSVPAIFAVPEEDGTVPPDPTFSEALACATELFEMVGSDGLVDLLGFEPPFYLPTPSLLKPAKDEMIWLNPVESLPHLEWDYTMCEDAVQRDLIRRLMRKALRAPLTMAQQQTVLKLLEGDPQLVYACHLAPEKLPDLVDNNPSLAIEALLRLVDSSQFKEYLNVLVNINMSLHSMEVVNRLASAVDLPATFVHRYISNCIHTCETIRDKYMQNRQVRLVCVFLQSLIRNRIVAINDVFVEIQAFCIQFSRIREAAGLFRLLKKEGPAVGGTPPK
ncbi:hypothetical protein BDK51DRAFT_30456 [Blyttiomyces helicus]|uniref:CCR4-NOT transcription complex subunit 11 n=1 Tax=Blyttiomyces helicus TaxID=388810 RepID=A0A4V1IRJ0_9FUNG|nr:hypothetical protein BDK51DRAFT_30456 [Blyttiomyces helicus]|eukprot:RKO90227.1 hypothetical protein BDK51DRAFT_30456 [Blyttiomyces helicus]